MKRRTVIRSVVGLPVVGALPLPAVAQEPARALNETPNLETAVADAAAMGVPRFFSDDQFTALKCLCELLAPAAGGNPGASEAGAAEFLDFLVGQSPGERQTLYREGLNRLNGAAQQRFGKRFADVAVADADALLSPLRESWTYSGPADPFAKFLQTAKLDAMSATMNSREWSVARSRSSRRAGLNLYWYPVE